MSDRTIIVACDAWVSVDELARGLEWVHWLFQSVRARCDGVVFVAPGVRPEDVMQGWDAYVESVFQPVIGPRLVDAWQAAVNGRSAGLRAVDELLDQGLEATAAERSRRAGAVLLRTTRGARYQGVLGHYRNEVVAGLAAGHLATVWPAVAHFFQLGLSNVLAEYLRIEWQLGSGSSPFLRQPQGRHSITGLVSQLLHSQTSQPRSMTGG